MKEITIQLEDEEFTTVARIAALRGVSVEERTLDALRYAVRTDLDDKVEYVIGTGMEQAPLKEAEVSAESSSPK